MCKRGHSNSRGGRIGAHRVLPKGTHVYEFEVTYQLKLQKDATIHAMAAHLHPNAVSFSLIDETTGEEVYTINCENYDHKIGLKNVPIYSSTEGLPIYRDHRYKLRLLADNPREGFSDMMAVLFIYLYDEEMDKHLKSL